MNQRQESGGSGSRLFSVLAVWLQAYETRVTIKAPGFWLRPRGPPCMSQRPGRSGHMGEAGGEGRGELAASPAAATQASCWGGGADGGVDMGRCIPYTRAFQMCV